MRRLLPLVIVAVLAGAYQAMAVGAVTPSPNPIAASASPTAPASVQSASLSVTSVPTPTPTLTGGISVERAVALAGQQSSLTTQLFAEAGRFGDLTSFDPQLGDATALAFGRLVWVVVFGGDIKVCGMTTTSCPPPRPAIRAVVLDYASGQVLLSDTVAPAPGLSQARAVALARTLTPRWAKGTLLWAVAGPFALLGDPHPLDRTAIVPAADTWVWRIELGSRLEGQGTTALFDYHSGLVLDVEDWIS